MVPQEAAVQLTAYPLPSQHTHRGIGGTVRACPEPACTCPLTPPGKKERPRATTSFGEKVASRIAPDKRSSEHCGGPGEESPPRGSRRPVVLEPAQIPGMDIDPAQADAGPVLDRDVAQLPLPELYRQGPGPAPGLRSRPQNHLARAAGQTSNPYRSVPPRCRCPCPAVCLMVNEGRAG